MNVGEPKFTVGSINSDPDELSPLLVDGTGSQRVQSVSELKNKQHCEFDRQSPRAGAEYYSESPMSCGSQSDVDRKRRKPFHYSTIPTYTTDSGNLQHPVDYQDSATMSRVRYYQRLQPNPSQGLLTVPDHVLPPHIFSVFPSNVISDAQGKQHSIITIFSIWNTMMGTSLLSMPWAIHQAGFGMGIGLLVVMAGITLYTCYRVVQSVERVENDGILVEFSDVCKLHFGRWGEFLSVFFSLSALIGAMVVYWVLMSNFLYSTVAFFYHTFHKTSVNYTSSYMATPAEVICMTSNSSLTPAKNTSSSTFDLVWDQTKTVPLFLCLIIFPIINFKSPTFFTKFNALGTLSVMFLFTFVSVKAAQWGVHMDFNDPKSQVYVQVFSWDFPALTGILALGYFIHNCVSSIIRNQKHPENNGRDLTIAYFLVAATYIFVGVVFYMTFPLKKECIADNLLNNFSHKDVLSFAARFFLLFQMITLFPLLIFITRVQCMDQLFGKAYPSVKHVLVLNLILLTICIIFAIFLPSIGTIIRFSGAFCGLAYIFTLPCLIYLLHQKQCGTLSWPKLLFHGCLIVLGLANFIAQFLLL